LSFVVYDVETTGLIRGFDQILHFGAIKADADLNEVERFELRSRLLPHIVPAPRALHTTGLHINDITDANHISHYEMVCRIYRTLAAWCPSVFLGYNSIQFDEEFVRQAFYQCLHRPYLTNTNGNSRADVLKLMRAVAALHPDVLTAPKGADGRATFRLGELANANGIELKNGHNAMADVEATLALCRIARDGAPDLWSRFLRFANKAVVTNFVREESAFLLFEYFGARQDVHILTDVGTNSEQTNVHYCLDLSLDLEVLRALSEEELMARLNEEPRPIRRLRVNAAPLLCPIFEALPEHLGSFTEDEIIERASSVRADEQFVRRLVSAAVASERVYEPSSHVEQQLYGFGFPNDSDQQLMDSFHVSPWEERVAIGSRFQDARLRRLVRRLIYFERPDLLDESTRRAVEGEIGRRLLGTTTEQGPWLTIPSALTELDALLLEVDVAAHPPLTEYRQHLIQAQAKLSSS
jgi:exodeoxyribonuclease-1